MADIFNLSDTWNSGGTSFDAIKVAVTNTASANTSKLINFTVGGTQYFHVLVSMAGYSVSEQSGVGVANSFVTARTAMRGSGGSTGVFGTTNSGFWWDSSGAPDWNSYTADTGLSRNAAGVVEINNGTAGTFRDLYARYVRHNGTTVAGLVAAATAGAGAVAYVTDATATTVRSTVAGGGANKVMVFSDGTNWLIMC